METFADQSQGRSGNQRQWAMLKSITIIFIRGEIEANSVKFVLKHLAYDTVINLKIGPKNYVRYVRNDIGHSIKETTSLWLKK